MSHYTLSKNIVQNIVQIEREDRYSRKLNRSPFAPTLVRELHAAGASKRYLAHRFGCTPEAIRQCVTFKTYRNV